MKYIVVYTWKLSKRINDLTKQQQPQFFFLKHRTKAIFISYLNVPRFVLCFLAFMTRSKIHVIWEEKYFLNETSKYISVTCHTLMYVCFPSHKWYSHYLLDIVLKRISCETNGFWWSAINNTIIEDSIIFTK